MRKSQLLTSIASLCVGARQTLRQLKRGDEIEHQGSGFGDLVNDTEIRADRLLGEYAQTTITSWRMEENPVMEIHVEGMPRKDLGPQGLRVYVDPLDGSLNYLLRGVHESSAPHSFVVTVVRDCRNPTFSDIIAAGLIDLRHGDIWLANKESTGIVTVVNGRNARELLLKHDTLDLGKMILLGEMYYPRNRQRLVIGLGDRKGSLRSFGSAALEMGWVSSGLAAAFICDSQKQHELGAGYLFALGAGAHVSDLEGKPLDEVPFVFEQTQTPVIIACTPALGREMVQLFGKRLDSLIT